MMTFLWVAGTIAFVFGLVQWARGGAVLWDISHIGATAAPEDAAERKRRETVIKNMEKSSDMLLKSSFRIIGVLALGAWIFLTLTVVFDALEIDLIERLSFKARSFWGSPVVRAGSTNPGTAGGGNRREDVLKFIGGGLKR